ncbi:hypothetical protein [Archangium lansingense]|uniref:Uncharacterized protein n=1 Tax=Archangium lansingense TaxID=2995310 RepID=A0ABT4ANQ8_9BACT|nr:hypothetical protein [Archangium lansinium]MCY1083323.1 hypothetical protein [Archangium lansinium]
MRKLRLLPLVAALALPGCQTEESGPVTIRIFNRNPATGEYGEFDASFSTLADAHTLRGALGAVKTQATWLLSDNVQGSAGFLVEGSEAPLCAYHVRDGVWIPEDFDTAAMASTYWGLDQSRSFFIRLGLGEAELTPMDIHFNPRVELAFPNIPTFWLFTDNAGYVPTLDAFQIIPHVYYKPEVPFFMNQGVLAHEYGHRVFALLAENGSRKAVDTEWSEPSQLQYDALNEALSDVFAGTMTGNADFIADSVALEGRDMSVVRVMGDADVRKLITATTPEGEADLGPHGMGAFIAAALWQLGENVGDHERVARAVIETERTMGAQLAAAPTSQFNLVEWFNLFSTHLSSSEQAAFCPLLKERFSLLFEADSAHPLTACP